MQYFKNYVSNTYAGSGNHAFFNLPEGEICTGRIFYKISVGGEYNYSLLFSNIMDGTLADGKESYKNLICSPWNIHSAKIGKCHYIPDTRPVTEMTVGDGENSSADIKVCDFVEITFDGNKQKKVSAGEFFASDPVKLSYEKDEYLCLELTFSGEMIPYHHDSTLPIFTMQNGEWSYSKLMPVVGMVGCDRSVEKRIAYVGDSITQGVGMEVNSYLHWNALLSERLGEQNAYWNLGIGFGRANDLASNGAWFYKAIQNDIIFVCFGVNDVEWIGCEEQLKLDLTKIVCDLKALGKTVILQSVPPFNQTGEKIGIWQNVNKFIRTELKDKADLFFDCVPCICESEEKPYNIKEEMHPEGDLHPGIKGCAAWADAIYETVKDFFAH